MSKQELSTKWAHTTEYPFDSTIKLMSVIQKNKESGVSYAFSKGAPERILPKCTGIMETTTPSPLTPEIVKKVRCKLTSQLSSLRLKNEELASKGLRVLALAMKVMNNGNHPKREEVECNLNFLGYIGIQDPPREGVAESIQICEKAGILVRMVTGDHPSTAKAIAMKVTSFKTKNLCNRLEY